jgi:D-amino peptidase
MMEGIDASFDAAILVGYHAMAGTAAGVMEHTISGGVHRLFVNGVECGEMGLSAGVAGRYGVPLVMVSSDQAGCDELSKLIPGIETAVTKTGYGRYMGKLRHPSETGPAIEEATFRGLKSSSVKPHVWAEPCRFSIEFNRSEEADMCAKLPRVKRVNGFTLEGEFPTYQEAHQVIWNLLAMSFEGIGCQS